MVEITAAQKKRVLYVVFSFAGTVHGTMFKFLDCMHSARMQARVCIVVFVCLYCNGSNMGVGVYARYNSDQRITVYYYCILVSV